MRGVPMRVLIACSNGGKKNGSTEEKSFSRKKDEKTL